MRAPYGMSIQDNCVECAMRQQHLLCGVAKPALEQLNEVKSTAIYPKSAVLFIEGQKPRGIFVLCSGKAKLSASSRDGKTVITRIAAPGDVLGLGASISNRPYEVTAEMIEPGQVNFVPRDALLYMVGHDPDLALRVGQLLSLDYYNAHEEIRTLGVTRSPAEKLAKLLLSWYPQEEHAHNGANIKVGFTHGEIAEMIGTTRETVTRLFAEFTRKKLLQRAGATLMFRDKAGLAQIVRY